MLALSSRLASAAPTRNLGLVSLVRPLHTTQHRLFAQPPPPPPQHELNEAEQYLANKAARKAERARNPTGASARHASLYSQLFPALLRILAYGSTAYFGLHLLWNVLDRDEQTKLMNQHAGSLEGTAKSLAAKVDHATQKLAPSLAAAEPGQSQPKKRWYWPF